MWLKSSVVLVTLALAGCDGGVTVRDVCDEVPAMCNDLNTDAHCREQRAQVILSRYHEYQSATDDNKYELLRHLESYSQCVSLASKIEHVKLKEKTTSRVEGYMTSLKEINRLFKETRDSDHPGLLYYQWSRNNNQAALNKLLAMEQTDAVRNNPEYQFFLASYYIKLDTDKTVDLLYHSLELNKPGQIPNPEIFTTLVNIFYKQEKYTLAYTFARIAKESGVENIDFTPMKHQLTASGIDSDKYDTLASKTLTDILEGRFKSPRS